MEEIRLLKELGLDKHLHIVGYVLTFSFMVKTLYKSHIQELLNNIKNLSSRTNKKISETFRPSLYEILPSKGKKFFDLIEAVWSYFLTIITLLYFVAFLILSRYISWGGFNIKKGIIYFGTLIFLITLLLASVANGNKAVQRFLKGSG